MNRVRQKSYTRNEPYQTPGRWVLTSRPVSTLLAHLWRAQQEWQEFTDDDGNPYWYNSASGVSQYENPLGGPAWTGGSITTASEGEGQGERRKSPRHYCSVTS